MNGSCGTPLHPRVLAVRCDRGTAHTIRSVTDRCGAEAQVVDDVLAAIVATARWSPGLVLLPVAEATSDLVVALRSAGRFELILLGNASRGTAEVADAVLPLPLSASQLAVRIALAVSVPAALPTQEWPTRNGDIRHLRVGRVELDLLSRTVVVLGRPGMVHLTGRESELLHDLMEHAGQPRSRADLLLAVWGIDFAATTTVVEGTMSRLRAKTNLDELRTMRTTGYRFASVEASPILEDDWPAPADRASRTRINLAAPIAHTRPGDYDQPDTGKDDKQLVSDFID